MIRLGLAAVLVGYLPGALLYRLPVWQRARRAALPADERVFWAVLLSGVWSVMAVMGMAAAGTYSFDRLLGLNGGVCAVLLLAFRQRLMYRGEAPRPAPTALIPLALIALGLWMASPPAEYVMGGRDPGVYFNQGIQIAQRGDLITRDPVVAAVPQALGHLFHPRQESDTYYGLRFMGFLIRDPVQGTVIGQFPQGYPASIAIGYGLHGLTGARWATGAWTVLALVGLYLLAVRIVGRVAATAAAVLLALNVAWVWYGRYPNSEVAAAALLMGALLAFGRLVDGDRGFFGAVAGALLGLQLFFRYDAVLAICGFAAAAVLLSAARVRVGWAFPSMLLVTGGVGFWYITVPMAAYTEWYVDFTRTEGGPGLLAALAGAVVYRLLVRRETWAARARWIVPAGFTLTLTVLAFYAYFIRQGGGRLSIPDGMALRVFAWYVSWGLFAAVAGLVLLAPRLFWRAPAFFMTLAAHAVFFFYKMRIWHEHFWASRRFVTMLLPAAMLLAAGGVAWLLAPERLSRLAGRARAQGIGWQALSAGLVAVVLMPLALTYWRTAAPVRSHVEYRGLIPELERLSGQIGDRDLLLVEAREADTDLHVLALPLAYIYARDVLVLDNSRPDKRALEDFVGWASSHYDRVLFMGGGGTDLLSRHLVARRVMTTRFRVPEYESAFNAFPDSIRHKEFDITIFELEQHPGLEAGPIDIRIGGEDDLSVLNFFAREQQAESGLAFRWTKNMSHVMLLAIEPGARDLTVWMSSGGRPASAPPAIVGVSLDGVELGQATLEDEIRPYRFTIPRELAERGADQADPLRLTLDVPVWNPQQWLGAADSRDLGVLVTRVRVQ